MAGGGCLARDLPFRTYAAEDDTEPDEPTFAVDRDAVRTAAQRNDTELLWHGPSMVGHPRRPPDVRQHAAMHWREQFVWSRLLSDHDTGRALLRKGITDLTDQCLGENADGWTNGRRLIQDPDFPGSVTQLLQEAPS